jgi:hypothetical protein
MYKSLGLILLAGLVSGLFLGCEPKEKGYGQGVAVAPGQELGIGSRFADFQFVDQNGITRTLLSIRGQFTILTFTECAAQYNPSISQIASFVGKNSGWRVRVVGIDIVWSPQGCALGTMCKIFPTSPDSPNFLAVCDEGNIIRPKYGVKKSGRYFVINNLGKIVDKGSLNDIEGLKSKLTTMIDDYVASEQSSWQD